MDPLAEEAELEKQFNQLSINSTRKHRLISKQDYINCY
jgi:hypothetical protein